MNKIYDKLLLLVAALLLAGGVVLYLQKSGATPSLSAPVNAEPADNPYQAEPVPASESTSAVWPDAPEQSTGWFYDVFTPPKIYIDKEGQFTAEGWTPPPPPVPFGVYLADIERKPYRIQLEGYIEEDRSDPLKTLLLMYDEEAKKQVRARPGDVKPEAEFKLLSFEIERVRDADNNIDVIAEAKILDQRSGEEVTLVHGERRFDSGVTVVIKSEQDPGVEIMLSEAPTEFETPSGQYVLEEINLEDSSVTVKKQGIDDVEPETRTLKIRSAAASAPAKNTPKNSIKEEATDAFDFMF